VGGVLDSRIAAPHAGECAVPKISFTTLVAVVVAAAVGYLAFNPDAAESVINWMRNLVTGGGPDASGLNSTGYGPTIPGR